MLMASRTPPFSLLGSHSETVAQRQALCYSEAFLYPNHCYASVTFPLSKIYLGTLFPVRQCWEVIEYGGALPSWVQGVEGAWWRELIPFVTFCCVRYNISSLQRLEHSSCQVGSRDQTYEPSDA